MFRLTIDTDNDAFGPTARHEAREVAAALRIVAIALEQAWREGMREGTVRDYNGNTVGQWTLDDEADARLIAAAPEILAALKARMETSPGQGPHYFAVIEQCRAAIAKAEGRTP